MKPLTKNLTTQAELELVNKYIFVEDYKNAEQLLKNIFLYNSNNFEVVFKRIDLAKKNSSLETLLKELLNFRSTNEHSIAIEAGIILTKIKINLNKKNMHNQSQKKIFDYESLEALLPIKVKNKQITLTRNLIYLDDKENDSSQKPNAKSQELNNLLQEAFDFYTKNNKSYGACYLAGYAYYYLGFFKDSYLKLKEAITLNTQSAMTLQLLTDLQDKGLLPDTKEDFLLQLENVDKYLVYGKFNTHTEVYREFLSRKEYENSVKAFKILYHWLQKEYGNIPMEVELSCLLGIMKAYELQGNSSSYEAAKHDVENFILSLEKSETIPEEIFFVAELCESYGITHLAKNCFLWILRNKKSSTTLCVKVSNHCASKYASERFLNELKLAYENHNESEDLRESILICQLVMNNINPNEYMGVKEKIRNLMLSDNHDSSIEHLNELCIKFSYDPEIHLLLAEIFFSQNNNKKAFTHFRAMYALDKYNFESSIKYLYFLLKNQDFINARNICEDLKKIKNIPMHISAEINWCFSICEMSEKNHEKAKNFISDALSIEPWNPNYISLYIRCLLNIYNQDFLLEGKDIINQIEDYFAKKDDLNEKKIKTCIKNTETFSLNCLEKGFYDISWSFSKLIYILEEKINPEIIILLSKTGSAHLPQESVKELLLILKLSQSQDVKLDLIFLIIANIYANCAQWKLADEWINMMNINYNHSFEGKNLSFFYSLKVLVSFMQGNTEKKSIPYLEISSESLESSSLDILENQCMLIYALSCQGSLAEAAKRFESLNFDQISIQGCYFLVKAIYRLNKLDKLPGHIISTIVKFSPSNIKERNMLNELFVILGYQLNLPTIDLAS